MNKLFTKIVGAVLGLTMAIGVGVAVASNSKAAEPVHAAEDVFYELSPATGSNNSYAGNCDVECDGITWNVNGNAQMIPWRLGGKQISNTNRTVYSKTSMGEVITKIELTTGTASSCTVNSIKLEVGNSGFSTITDTVTKSSSLVNTTLTYSPNSGKTWASGSYYRFTFNVTVSGKSNKFVEFVGAKFYYEKSTPATGVSLSSANFTPENDVITLNVGDGTNNVVEDTLTATVTPPAAPQIVTWTSSNENVAVVIDGEVVVDTSAAGEATITATASTGSPAPTAAMTYSVIDPGAATLDHVTVTGSAVSPQYAGNSFNYTGLTFTAVYDDESSETITGGDISWNTLAVGNAATGTYTAGGTTVNVSVPVTVLANTLTVSITGSSLTKTSYGTNESWTYAPLTASGSYADGSSYTGSFTWSYSPATPAAMGVGDGQTLRITATASSNESAYVDVTVNVTAPTYTNTTNLTPGNYYIKHGTRYLSAIPGSTAGTGASSATKSDAMVFTFALVGNDTWTVKNGDKYMAIGTTSKSLTLETSSTELAISWSTQASGTRKITGSSGRSLAWYSSDNTFRTYNSASDDYEILLESAKTVSGFSVYSTGANKNVLKGTDFTAEVAAAAGFQARLNYTDETFDDVTSAATWTLDTTSTGTKTLTVTYLEYTPVTINDMVVYVVTMDHLVIDSSEAKTTGYYVGDTLDTTNVTVTGVDDSDNEYPMSLSDVTFSPTTLSSSGSQTITVTYVNDDESEATGTYTVTVSVFSGYMKVSNAEGLVAGDRYVLGFEGKTVLMGSYWTDKSVRNVVTDVEFSAGGNGVTESEVSSKGAHIITLIGNGEGGFYIYDIADAKFLKGSSSAADTTNVDFDEATSWTISFTDGEMAILGDTGRYLEYNNSSPRVGSYTSHGTSAYPAPILYRLSGSSLKTSIETFNSTKLHMEDYDTNKGWCSDSEHHYYLTAKAAYNDLVAAEQQLFKTSSEYSTARARYEAWAIANKDGAPYDGNDDIQTQLSANVLSTIIGNSSNTVAIIVVISMVSVTAIGGYFFLRKRKEN